MLFKLLMVLVIDGLDMYFVNEIIDGFCFEDFIFID